MMGGRGGRINIYKIYPSETRRKFSLACYLHGAMQSELTFDTLEEAQKYADLDFAQWLKLMKLRAL